jgi:hypothetical protein
MVCMDICSFSIYVAIFSAGLSLCRCQMPMCKSSRRKVKQLRALPTKLAELPDDIRSAIMDELRQYQSFFFNIKACNKT